MQEQPIRRRWIALTLVVLASIVAFVAIFSIWINRQILNTDNWTVTSSQLLEQPTIRNQVADFLVDELYANVDVEAEVRQALPERAQPLAGAAAAGLRTLATRATRELLARPRAQQAWENANREMHKLLIKVLEGGGPNISTNNGVVVLDLKSLLQQTQQQVGLGGRLANALPADAAEITILKSDQLAMAQDVFRTLRALPIVLVALSLLLFAIALWVSPGWRRQAVRAYGLGFIAAGALALAGLSMLGDEVTHTFAKTEASEPAVEQTWTVSTSLLNEVAVSTIGYGLLMFLGALLAGPNRPATSTRRFLAPYLREAGLAYVGLLALLAVGILWWAPTPATRNPVTAILLAILIALGFEGLRRRTAKEFPDADRRVAEQHGRERLARASASIRGWASNATVRKAAPVPAAEPRNGERLVQLEQLGRLKDSGTIDEDEFRAEKTRILSESAR